MKLFTLIFTLISALMLSVTPLMAAELSERELNDRYYQLERLIMAKQAELKYSKKLQAANARVIAQSLEEDIIRLTAEKDRIADQLGDFDDSKN